MARTIVLVAGRRWGEFSDSSIVRPCAQSRSEIEFPRARAPLLRPNTNFLLRQRRAALRSSRRRSVSASLTATIAHEPVHCLVRSRYVSSTPDRQVLRRSIADEREIPRISDKCPPSDDSSVADRNPAELEQRGATLRRSSEGDVAVLGNRTNVRRHARSCADSGCHGHPPDRLKLHDSDLIQRS